MHLLRKLHAFSIAEKMIGISKGIGGKMRLKIRPAGRGDYPFCLHRSDSDGRSILLKAMSSWSWIGAVIN